MKEKKTLWTLDEDTEVNLTSKSIKKLFFMNKFTKVSLKITKKKFNDKHSVLLGFRQTLVIVNYIFMYYLSGE